jgi:hypothetical protein
VSEDTLYPRIETTERGYREFLRTHPRKQHLRRYAVPNMPSDFTVIYDHEKFEADKAHAKSPSRFAVATRSFDPRTSEWCFHILPNGSQNVW